jgi:hypothetical protein
VTYFADMLFRGAKPAEADNEMNRAERQAKVILANSLSSDMAPGDTAYLGQLVANQTGLPQAQAELRVTQVTAAAKLAAEASAAKVRATAEAARKAAAYTALWVFVSLLAGAFYSSLAATWGGRQRDPRSYVRAVV